MELLAPAKNLQRYSVQAIEDLFPELHGWGRAIHLNESGVPGDPIALWEIKNGVLQPDIIGESSILYQSGDASTWQTTAVWGFERTAVTIALDTSLGGGVLFIGETPRYLTWTDWMMLVGINVDYLFVGIKGIAGYSADQTANATEIRRYLNSVDQDFIADIFNGLDANGFTFANPPVAIDQDGKLRISPASVLAISGGYFNETTPGWEERTPAPAKKTLGTLTGSKTVYADIDPTVWRRAKIEPTRTNKVTARKINPVDTTNTDISNATRDIVDDSAALTAVGLDKICTSGMVYEFALGAVTGLGVFLGATGNLNKHSMFVYARVVSGALNAAQFGFSGVSGRPTVPSNAYTQIKFENVTPSATTNALILYNATASPVTIRCILPQLEEGPFVTAPIITDADPLAAITRSGAAITKETANVLGGQNIAFYMRFSMMSAGQVAKLWSSYTDANNCLCLETTATALLIKKIVAGTTTSVSLAHTHAALVPIEILAIQSDMGMAAKFRTYTGGAWSAWSAYVDDATAAGKAAAVIAAIMELSAANSTGHMSGNVQLFAPIKLGSQVSLANYKSVAEQEVNKINA